MPYAHRLRALLAAQVVAKVVEAAPVVEPKPSPEPTPIFRSHDYPDPPQEPMSFRCLVLDHQHCKGEARVVSHTSGLRIRVPCRCICHRGIA